MNAITLDQLCDEINIKFVEVANEKRELKDNEYYALVVIEQDDRFKRNSPHVRGIEPTIHEYIVGIEKYSGIGNWYISKNFYNRRNISRGITIIVEVDDTTKFSVLDFN